MKKITFLSFAIALTLASFNLKAQTPPVLIGTASQGGSGYGTIYYNPLGSGALNNTTNFAGSGQGSNPGGSVVLAPNGKFYGMTTSGGSNGYGVIYEFGYTGPTNVKVNFIGGATSGSNPSGALTLANDGNLYGLTLGGGANGYGCLFRYVPGSSSISVLYSFSSLTGNSPAGSLIQANDNLLYGMTTGGGTNSNGVVFSYNIGLSQYTVIHNFNGSIEGSGPKGDLLQASDGKLYGLTYTGGTGNSGTLFSCNLSGTPFNVLRNFNSATDGANAYGHLVEGAAGILYGLTSTGGTNNYGTLFEYNVGTTAFIVRHTFSNVNPEGGTPLGSLMKASNGIFYGTTNVGPGGGTGTLFQYDPSGPTFTTTASFTGTIGGSNPTYSSLIEYQPLDATLNPNNVTCYGAGNGSATAVPTGGTAPYMFNWTPVGGTGATATGLNPGTYTCTITEAGGFQIIKTVSITQPPVLNAIISGQNNVACNGGNNGNATISPSGGAPGYTYNWAPLGGTGIVGAGLLAGTYTCTVTDAHSCITTQTVTITQPPPITSSIGSQANVSCFGGSNGSATVTVGGGTPGYTFSWAPSGGTGTTATGLVAGTYTCTITDANSCVKTQTVTITQPTALTSIISSQTNVSCNGVGDGSATVSPAGGTPSYTYSWTPFGGTGTTAAGLVAGNYTCTITDANSCTKTQTVTITQPTILSSSFTSQTNVSCSGGNNGSLTITPTGGTPGYTYSWAPSGSTTAIVSGLTAGIYTSTVTDTHGCTSTQTVSITEPAAITCFISSQTNVTCNGGSNGTASVSAGGGTAPLSYNWSPSGGTSATATGLPAGNYTCTITDNNSCIKTTTTTITEPSILTSSISSQTNISCFSGSNGSATVSVGGGTPGYTYSWIPSGGTGTTATGLVAGTYTCIITDANSCTKSQIVTLTQPPVLVVNPSTSNDVSCYSGNDGSASINAPTGGTAGYTIDWTPGTPTGDGTTNISGLTIGTYTCTVTDANSCVSSATLIINQPPALTIGVGSTTNVTCNAGSDGSITMNVGGGSTPYSFAWSPSGGSATTANGLTAGSYTCNITDNHGCPINKSATITEPSAIVPNIISQTDVTCNGSNDGNASIGASGGTPGYTYLWNDGALQSTATASSLIAGNYTCTITDANGCSVGQPITITEPPALISGITSTDALCNGSSDGSVSTNVIGGTPGFTYSWAPLGGTSATSTGIGHGTYTVTITDANGCILIDSVIVSEPTSMVNNMSGTDVTCFGNNDGTAVDNVTGGSTPYTFSWSPSGQTTQTAIGIGPGNYTCTVTDAHGCVVSDFSTIAEPAPLMANATETNPAGCSGQANGIADVAVTGGIAPYFYSWTSGGLNSTETGLVAGTYTVSITDNNSCPSSATVTITENSNTDLLGTLTFSGGAINSGTVYAFKQQSSSNGIDTVAMVPVTGGASGSYLFSGLAADNYFIKVVLDTTGNPSAVPTYYGNTFEWDSSTVVVHGCLQTDTADIDVIALPSNTGSGFISGFIIEGNGYQGLRLNHSGHNPDVPFAPGGPLKGIDVKLGKNPGGGIQARVMSDSTGYYEFNNIPDGNYRIFVDIPNLPMDSLREVTIGPSADTSFQNNYIADSLVIYVDTAQATAIHASQKEYNNKFNVFPNPTNNIINLSFILEQDPNNAFIEINNAMGDNVYTHKSNAVSKGENIISVKASELHLQAGVYFVSLVIENQRYTQRIVVLE